MRMKYTIWVVMLYISFVKNEIYQLGHIPNKSVWLTQSLCLTFAIPHMFQFEWTQSKQSHFLYIWKYAIANIFEISHRLLRNKDLQYRNVHKSKTFLKGTQTISTDFFVLWSFQFPRRKNFTDEAAFSESKIQRFILKIFNLTYMLWYQRFHDSVLKLNYYETVYDISDTQF